ncbi:hypothetical protein ACE1B6_27470 [Aerosakkonemataceae cyanobacterium BLCC-F154]|uniref:Uncharacterized protein n=1 Tax=Floridaenema fluviatile BLCC-F154 TaxID=3153640 RepID=A0ABV4YJK2_9CYAN
MGLLLIIKSDRISCYVSINLVSAIDQKRNSFRRSLKVQPSYFLASAFVVNV